MDDLISRQAAIDEIKNMYEAAEKWKCEVTDEMIEARAESCMASLIEMKLRIEKLPSAQQWIPCSERLPDKNCRCLTTNDAWGAFDVDWNAWIDGQWLYPNEKPVAWMPLPEPYKGGGQDEQIH